MSDLDRILKLAGMNGLYESALNSFLEVSMGDDE